MNFVSQWLQVSICLRTGISVWRFRLASYEECDFTHFALRVKCRIHYKQAFILNAWSGAGEINLGLNLSGTVWNLRDPSWRIYVEYISDGRDQGVERCPDRCVGTSVLEFTVSFSLLSFVSLRACSLYSIHKIHNQYKIHITYNIYSTLFLCFVVIY